MKFDGKKILVVAPDFPYPPNHGGRVDIWGRLKALVRLGFTVDLTVTSKLEPSSNEIDEVMKLVRKIYFCPRVNSLGDFFSFWPVQLNSRDGLRKVAFSDKYDVVLLESEYVFPVLDNKTLNGDVRMIRIMDHSSRYFWELARSSGLGFRKIYFLTESWKFKRMEQEVAQRLPNMMFISNEEMEDFRSHYGSINGVFLPAALDIANFREHPKDSRQVLFIGSLFMDNNIDGALWYIREVHALVPDCRLVIAGNSRGRDLSLLRKEATRYGDIDVIESPSELKPLYEASAVFINPMRHGAGVKVKNIEAIRNGLPVVTTSVGNEGTGLVGGEEIFVADESEKFALYISELLNNRGRRVEMLRKAQEKLKRDYDQERILGEYLAHILERSEK